MVVKRKRSDDAMSICSTSSDHSSTSPFAGNAMMIDNDAITQHHIPLGVDSRTLKRYRDSRPDEKTVHDYTISKLFSAQRSSNSQPTAPQIAISPAFAGQANHSHQPMQRNITSFFRRDPALMTTFTGNQPPPQVNTTTLTCSDCDSSLQTLPHDEEGESYACSGCRKMVCGGCSTGGLEWGMERRCLECTLR
ncbi:hypothetical protein TWF481_001338 [Arthrobotrys musiformis]|uniref:FYVE-type domain-containing protein n=1 Tax=Arthrobotrys musiformis TaxID=47236 RepID=A0AAV9WQ99_9PEZI